jgi:hypothetical protein
MMMFRMRLLSWDCSCSGGPPGSLEARVLSGSYAGDSGPVGASGSGCCAVPQLGQKLAVCLTSAPQFSQNRLPPSAKASYPPMCPTLRRADCA